MLSRLVVGGGAVRERVLDATVDAPGEVGLLLTPDDESDLDAAEVAVDRGDPTDPADYPAADVVLVGDLPADRARAVATAARTALPDATLVVALGTDATDADRAAVSEVADRVVDGTAAVADGVLDAVVGPGGSRARHLRRTLRSLDGHLAIVMHDNPDPDAIASAVALARVAERVGVDATPCYYGRVSHQQNRAMVNLLGLDMRRLSPDEDLDEFDGFALVDHSRPGVNDQLPADLSVDIVIDHHPPREAIQATFVDLRSEVGATSTLLTGYLARFGVEEYGGDRIATALLYGIRVDTAEFTREATAADFEAAAALSAHADDGLLEQIESPSVTGETIDVFARAARERDVRGNALATCVGPIGDRDALAQAADRLLDLDDIATTLVFGYDDDAADRPTVFVSARSRGTRLDLGETLRLAFDGLGSAGGHADMAGAQIPVSAVGHDVLADDTDREAVIREVVTETFFDAIDDRPREVPRAGAEVYETDAGGYDLTEADELPPGALDGDGPRLLSSGDPSDALPVEWHIRDASD